MTLAFPDSPRQRPVRVAFVIDTLSSGAGTENQILLLIRSFDQARVKPAIYELREGASREPGTRSLSWTTYGISSLVGPKAILELLRMARCLRRDKIDLILTFFIDGNLVGTLTGLLAGVPVVSSRRNVGQGYWHTRGQLRVLRVLNRFTFRWLANSEATRRFVARNETVPIDQIGAIYNAVDTGKFRPGTPKERSEARDVLGFGAKDLLLSCVANLRKVKDHQTLLKAFALVLDQEPRTRLVLAGRGEEEESLRQLAESLGIEDRVHFLGGLEDTVGVYHASDAVVLSSVSESLPNAIVEALACGLPVAATDVGGIPELLAGRSFGRLAPPSSPEAMAKAILELLEGPVKDPRAKQEAREFAVASFSLPVVLERWYEFFETCVRETRR